MPYWLGLGAVHMPCWMQTSTTRWLRGIVSSFNNRCLWYYLPIITHRLVYFVVCLVTQTLGRSIKRHSFHRTFAGIHATKFSAIFDKRILTVGEVSLNGWFGFSSFCMHKKTTYFLVWSNPVQLNWRPTVL